MSKFIKIIKDLDDYVDYYLTETDYWLEQEVEAMFNAKMELNPTLSTQVDFLSLYVNDRIKEKERNEYLSILDTGADMINLHF